MARVSKTSPFRVRSHAEVRANTNTDSEKKEDTPSEPIPEEENSTSSTSDEEENSSSSTSDEEENSSSSTSDEEENDHEKGKGKRPMKRKVRKQQIRSVIGLSYSPEKAKEVRKLDAAFKRNASAAKRGRGRGRGRPTKERSVNVGSNAERKRKGKEKETDVFELSDTELEEVYKKFRMKGNDDDDSGDDGGGAGIGAQNLSNQVY